MDLILFKKRSIEPISKLSGSILHKEGVSEFFIIKRMVNVKKSIDEL